MSLNILAVATENLANLDNINQQVCTSQIFSNDERCRYNKDDTGQHLDGTKANSPWLDEELRKFKDLKN